MNSKKPSSNRIYFVHSLRSSGTKLLLTLTKAVDATSTGRSLWPKNKPIARCLIHFRTHTFYANFIRLSQHTKQYTDYFGCVWPKPEWMPFKLLSVSSSSLLLPRSRGFQSRCRSRYCWAVNWWRKRWGSIGLLVMNKLVSCLSPCPDYF